MRSSSSARVIDWPFTSAASSFGCSALGPPCWQAARAKGRASPASTRAKPCMIHLVPGRTPGAGRQYRHGGGCWIGRPPPALDGGRLDPGEAERAAEEGADRLERPRREIAAGLEPEHLAGLARGGVEAQGGLAGSPRVPGRVHEEERTGRDPGDGAGRVELRDPASRGREGE